MKSDRENEEEEEEATLSLHTKKTIFETEPSNLSPEITPQGGLGF